MKALYLGAALAALSSFSSAELYFGVQLGLYSRSGLILGYGLDDQHGIEAHIQPFGEVNTYGLSYKYRLSEGSGHYLLAGVSYNDIEVTLSLTELDEDERLEQGVEQIRHQVLGLNLGYGYEFDLDQGPWSFPFELGGGPGWDFVEQDTFPNLFVSPGIYYGAKAHH